MKYYRVKKDVEGILAIGERFFTFDDECLYPESAGISSSYLPISLITKRHPLEYYFEETPKFEPPLIRQLIAKADKEVLLAAGQVLSAQTRLNEASRVSRRFAELLGEK